VNGSQHPTRPTWLAAAVIGAVSLFLAYLGFIAAGLSVTASGIFGATNDTGTRLLGAVIGFVAGLSAAAAPAFLGWRFRDRRWLVVGAALAVVTWMALVGVYLTDP